MHIYASCELRWTTWLLGLTCSTKPSNLRSRRTLTGRVCTSWIEEASISFIHGHLSISARDLSAIRTVTLQRQDVLFHPETPSPRRFHGGIRLLRASPCISVYSVVNKALEFFFSLASP